MAPRPRIRTALFQRGPSSRGGQQVSVAGEGSTILEPIEEGQMTDGPVEKRDGHWASPRSSVAQTLDQVMKESWFTQLDADGNVMSG
ncbi:hypothetical protein IAU59_003889 [Kwoniella sp. CBS 9459]